MLDSNQSAKGHMIVAIKKKKGPILSVERPLTIVYLLSKEPFAIFWPCGNQFCPNICPNSAHFLAFSF